MISNRLARTLLTVLVVAAVAPAAASASTVAYSSVNVLTYTAANNEANRLTVTHNATHVIFTEAGSVNISEAEGDCSGTGTHVVSCKIAHSVANPVYSVHADLGNMDDRFTAAFPSGSDMNATASGGTGPDELDASGSTSPSLDGGAGTDKLTAGRAGESFLLGGPEADVEIGGPAGTTTFFQMGGVADGADELNGGAGQDVAEYDDRAAALNVSADGVANDGEAGEGDNVSPAVEAIQGGEAADVLTASASSDAALSGYSGADRLVGGPGDDSLFGGDGNDTLEGNVGDDTAISSDRTNVTLGGGFFADLGADSFAGGPGFDTIDYTDRLVPVSVSLNGQADDGEAGEGDNTGADVEQFIGGHGNDSLTGDDDAERFDSGAGNDTISPAGGVDDVSAGSGDDTIGAVDSIFDRIACGVGSDTVTADFADALDGCELATVGAAPTPPVVIPPDLTAPKIAITKLKTRQRFKNFVNGFRFRVGADEPAAFVIELLATARKATVARSNNLTLARKTLKLAPGVRSVKLRASRSLLGKKKTIKARLRVTAKDAAGNTRSVTRSIRVRR